MNVVARRFHDRAGNNLFQYVNARAYAERVGAELQTDPWWGQKVFGLTEKPISQELPPRHDLAFERWDGESNIELTGWCLSQTSIIYTQEEARTWLKFTDQIEELLVNIPLHNIAIHLRWGDFKTMEDFIAVSIGSYEKAIPSLLPNEDPEYHAVCAWNPYRIPELEKMDLGWLADFAILMRAKHLFRANSTFSYWAAVLGHSERVFSPNLKGIQPRAGEFQDVPFVEGNHCAISCFHNNCSDLYLKP